MVWNVVFYVTFQTSVHASFGNNVIDHFWFDQKLLQSIHLVHNKLSKPKFQVIEHYLHS
jgi:hypothetical protein